MKDLVLSPVQELITVAFEGKQSGAVLSMGTVEKKITTLTGLLEVIGKREALTIIQGDGLAKLVVIDTFSCYQVDNSQQTWLLLGRRYLPEEREFYRGEEVYLNIVVENGNITDSSIIKQLTDPETLLRRFQSLLGKYGLKRTE